MKPSGELILGGWNNISNTGTGTYNINVDGSHFYLDEGENIFNIYESESSYHLYGYFPLMPPVSTNETRNCFKLNNVAVDPPYHYVTWGAGGSQISFTFTPYLDGCLQDEGGEGMVLNLGNNIYDTVETLPGSGGEKAEVRSEKSEVRNKNENGVAFCLPFTKGEIKRGSYNIISPYQGEVACLLNPPTGGARLEGVVTFTPKQIYDSICILMRFRNYTQAKAKCYEMINTYTDSIQTIDALQKLFLSTIGSDTTQAGTTQLKTFYETLILNHGSNTALVKRANYFVQKCKVRLRQFTSALAGFQQIIDQNPYSYEGLVARWDYMATTLLMQGAGGKNTDVRGQKSEVRYNNESNYEFDEFDESDKTDEFDKLYDDRSPFTREERKQIRTSVNNAYDEWRQKQESAIEILNQRANNNDEKAINELKVRRTLKDVIKVQRPKNIIEHIQIVNSDIQKVFKNPEARNLNSTNQIPTTFNLSQNYPNPFNPRTVINYQLPIDTKVKQVVYDILGREVKVLVNEFKKAGYYKIDFDGTGLASGVYFYRIEADKFVLAKKMVYLK